MPLRNSLHRRNHKERSQLAHRQRFGILEKHKDYVLRARDYHAKQDRLKRLAQKAADRNKDEFYFGMSRQKTERGVHVHERGSSVLPTDIVKVLKTQDENYVRTMRAAGQKKIEKLKAHLTADTDLLSPASLQELDEDELEILREAGILPGPSKTRKNKPKKPSPTHVFFADDESDAREKATLLKNASASNDAKTSSTTPPTPAVDLGWKVPTAKNKKKKTATLPESGDEDGMDLDLEESAYEKEEYSTSKRTRYLKELSARLHRDRMLRYAERELEMQKLLMGKGAARKISGVEREHEDEESDEEDSRPRNRTGGDEKTYKPRVYKWRVERKR